MPRRTLSLTALLACSVIVFPALAQVPKSSTPARTAAKSLELLSRWEIQSSCDAKEPGDKISQAGFATKGWHKSTIPNTVVGTLVDDKKYPDPMFASNLKNLPGMNYSSATFFANQDMPDESPFKCSWWWRNDFELPATFAKKNITIHFPGSNNGRMDWSTGKKFPICKTLPGITRFSNFVWTTT